LAPESSGFSKQWEAVTCIVAASQRARFDRWLADAHDVLENLTDDDLQRMYRRDADSSQGTGAVERTIAECIAHALSHVALHLGHLQVQRQLWEQERGEDR
jgi:hypothetical protein